MVQDAGTSLQQKAVAKLFSRLGDRLDRHLATDGFVQSPVNDTHAANAQDAQDLVFADLRDCCAGIHAIRGSCSSVLNQLKSMIIRDLTA